MTLIVRRSTPALGVRGLAFFKSFVVEVAMAKRPKMWIYSPPKSAKPKVPDALKSEVADKANQLIEQHLKPAHIKKPPKDNRFNYIVDLYTKWYRSYFYFCSKYACPGPTAISPFFESRFARLEYVGGKKFNMAFMRHTGEWIEVMHDLTVEECMKVVKEDGFFQP